jgi:spermidine dehydrogenase
MEVKHDMLRWRRERRNYYGGPPELARDRWLDSMSYEQFLTKIVGLGPEPARYADPILAASGGLGSDVTSAYMAYAFGLPGFQGMQINHPLDYGYSLAAIDSRIQRFPGGNDGIMRALVKALIPEAIAGGTGFADIHNGAIRFEALDRAERPTRVRLGATVAAIEHEGARDKTERVVVTYLKDGQLWRVHAHGVVVASGSWAAKHLVRDLSDRYRTAMDRFYRSPMLNVNVALTNWRALYKLGYTAASWRGGFGFCFNLSPPMHIGDYAPEFDPDRPAVLTYYVPFYKVGLPVERQGAVGRAQLLSTSYREYETTVRAQLMEMLSPHGFDARRDIAGIILNRWGHAYVDPYPGFYFGQNGAPAPREILREPLGRISFGHSELRGHQSWIGAFEEGRRAAEQLLAHA